MNITTEQVARALAEMAPQLQDCSDMLVHMARKGWHLTVIKFADHFYSQATLSNKFDRAEFYVQAGVRHDVK